LLCLCVDCGQVKSILVWTLVWGCIDKQLGVCVCHGSRVVDLNIEGK
jgi:hypothetical protein